jgi:VWFA-related protein
MCRLMAPSALYAILLSLALTPAAPQNRTQSDKLTFSANLVLVPVVVTDKHGSHVRGLTRDDFEVKENGNVQKIASFEEITAESSAVQRPPVPPNVFTNQIIAQHAKKLEIIALDLVNTGFNDRYQARRGLVEFLSKSLGEDALLALLVFEPNRVRLVHNFTSDPSVLAAAIKRVEAPPSSQDTSTLGVTGDADAEAAQINAILSDTGEISNVPSQAPVKRAATVVDVSRQGRQDLIILECFQRAAQYLAGVPGRKSLIWASTGFKLTISPLPGALTGATPEDLQRTLRMLQDANVAVYPVDVSGLLAKAQNAPVVNNTPIPGSGGDVRARSAALGALDAGLLTDPTQDKHLYMGIMADATGGRAFYNNNNLEDLFRRASQDSGEYYMLAYYTSDTGKPGWRKLDVRIHRDGVQVRHRTGFFFTNAARDPETTRQADEVMALTSSLNFTSLPITATWQQTEPAGTNRKIHFSLSIPPSATNIDTDHENRISIDFLALALGAKGQEAAKVTQRVDRKLPPAGVAQIQARGITYSNVLTLVPGEYKVHIVVRDNLTGNIGSVVAPLKVE